ncbi:hypothetical protein BDK61_2636 [Haloarcula quadrata]|uniref:Uncharacterized protein n=1 Tax=Haloarcula quadrata TaxID=182779 RepID=A0A495R7K5_9EURY|nr:hypothetical protein [Haloarcula quadrata]RKS83293.1 hypothetical protein BDK61_2636 [Haloarcula quadrata]
MHIHSDESDEVDAERRYNRVLSAIYQQTSPMQRPGVTLETVCLTLVAHGSFERTGVKASLQAALDNDDAIAYKDEDGQLRFALLTDDSVDRLVAEYPEVADHDTIREYREDP